MMKIKAVFRYFGLILFFGLCIIILSGNTKASAGENEVKLNVSSVSITKDGSYRLKVYNLETGQTVLYRSGNPSVAMVSGTGKVTGLSYGETIITATVIQDGAPVASLQCNVIIGPAAVSIKLTKTSLVLQEGKQKLLTTVILPLNTVERPIFFSTDTEIAKVSSAGRVRAVIPGTAQIYAFLDNGQYAVCNVTVLDEENYEKYREGVSVEEILADDDNDDASDGGNDRSNESPADEQADPSGPAEPVDSTEPAEPTESAEEQGGNASPVDEVSTGIDETTDTTADSETASGETAVNE